MSLPCDFNDYREYFQEAYDFLTKYAWIYRSSNTQFIKDGILECIPKNWTSFVEALPPELYQQFPYFPHELVTASPKTMQIFVENLKRLTPSRYIIQIENNLTNSPMANIKGINPKKRHEILKLSEEIYNTCGSNVDFCVDLGSGLGYLSQILFQRYKYKILGLDMQQSYVETARARQVKYFPDSQNNVKYAQHKINASHSMDFIAQELSAQFTIDLNTVSTLKIALIGLHACADLSITALQLFLNMPNVNYLVIMPCCYHKMLCSNKECTQFVNLPLSDAMKNVNNWDKVTNRPFMRLASQQSINSWNTLSPIQHTKHGTEMFERAALESLIEPNEIVIKSGVKSTNIFERYCLYERGIKKIKPWIPTNIAKHEQEILLKYPNYAQLAEMLTGLQSSIQAICENIVLLDKICFLKEMSNCKTNGKETLNKVLAKKIFNEDISPRCSVLISSKR